MKMSVNEMKSEVTKALEAVKDLQRERELRESIRNKNNANAFNETEEPRKLDKEALEANEKEKVNKLNETENEKPRNLTDCTDTTDTNCTPSEYVVGGTIADVIRFGKFGTQLTQSFSKQILFGLEYLHHNNIVHRDLKGRNVLVCKNGLCKLSDFGTSSFFENPASYRAGTIHWMAPETFGNYREMSDAEIIKRQDIWSFGACIFEMMCGHPPLHTLQELQVVYWHTNYKDLEYPESIARDPILLDMVKRCVRLKPENRPTPTDLLEHPFFEQEYTDEEPGRLSIRSDSWGSNSMNFTIF